MIPRLWQYQHITMVLNENRSEAIDLPEQI